LSQFKRTLLTYLQPLGKFWKKITAQEEPKSLPPDAFSGLQICQNCFCGRGSAPNPTGGAYSAPPDSLAGLRGPTSKGRGKGRERTEEGKKREGDSREGDGTGKLRPLPFSNSWIRPWPDD